MGKRARIWTLILILLIAYIIINNYDRLPEYGSDLGKMWPLISVAIGFLILFRRKGRPKKDFFFNNPEFNKKLEELSRSDATKDSEKK